MQVYKMTSQDIDGLFENHYRMADLFSWLESEFALQGQLVCQFIVNGKKLTERDELDWAPKSLSEMQSMQILVQGEMDLIKDVLKLWIQALPEIEEFVETSLLHHPNVGGSGFVNRVVELTEQQESFVESLVSLKTALTRAGVPVDSWEPMEKALHQYVFQCVQAIEKQNYLQLLQTVEYDGCDVFRRWKEQLSATLIEVQKFRDKDTRTVLDLNRLKKESA